MLQGQTRKRLDIQRIAQIKNAAQVPLTLHGGSGTDDEDLRKAIAAGINIIHINTELRVAWRRGLEEGLSKQPHQTLNGTLSGLRRGHDPFGDEPAHLVTPAVGRKRGSGRIPLASFEKLREAILSSGCVATPEGQVLKAICAYLDLQERLGKCWY
jgi:hypothetical protein